MRSVAHFKGTDNCPQHGAYEFEGRRVGAIVLGNWCPQCRQSVQQQSEAINEAKDRAASAAAWESRQRIAGIPDAFFGADLDNYLPPTEGAKAMISIVRGYVKNFKTVLARKPRANGIVFSGAPGTGKTHVACAMVKEVIRAGHSGAYLSAPQFLLQARESQSFRSEEKTTSLLKRLSTPQLLVIDEFGTHTEQDIDYQVLFSLVDARYQNCLPTLLSTNLSAEALRNHVGDRFLERVHGPTEITLAFDWNSYRRPQDKNTTRTTGASR